MSRLNPLGDMERSLGDLSEQLESLKILPEIRDQLLEVNRNPTAICEALAAQEDPPAALPARVRRA